MNVMASNRINQKWILAGITSGLWLVCITWIIPHGWEEILNDVGTDLHSRMAWWQAATKINRKNYILFIGFAFTISLVLEIMAFMAAGALRASLGIRQAKFYQLLALLVGLRLFVYSLSEYMIISQHEWTAIHFISNMFYWFSYLVWIALLIPLLGWLWVK